MKKFFILLSSLVLVVSGLLIPLQKAAAISTADQYCLNTDLQSYESLKRNGVGSNYRQAFTPTQNRVNNIAVKVGGNNISGQATLRVYTSPSGTDNQLLRSDRTFTNLNDVETWYFNDFGDVTLTPGTTYYISLVTSIDFLYWYSVDAGGCTPSGLAYKDGVQMGYKLHYSTFGFTETAATPTEQSSTTTSAAAGETLGTTSASIVKPTNLAAVYSSDQNGVKLTWKATSTADIDGYKVFRAGTADKNPLKIASVAKDKLEYLDQDIAASQTYSYQVRAYKGDTQSASSNIATATVPDNIAPAKPISFKVVDKTFSMLTVAWRKSADTTISGYTLNIYKGGSKVSTTDVPSTVHIYSFLNLDAGTMYKIDLVAKNAKGQSSTPAITVGFTQLPAEIERFMDTTKELAAIAVLILLLALALRTKKHYKKNS